jgi:acyl-[acyl-carrier-protein] desaturase
MATTLVSELEPVAGQLLERHLKASKEWFPHEFIPYERGRPVKRTWSPEDTDLGGAVIDDAVRSGLFVNLLTEDNLPYYFRDVQRLFGNDDAWGEWTRRWTAEEGRHSMAIFGYLMVSRAVDPVQLERGRMSQVTTGEVPAPPGPSHALVYLTLQELATRISHRNMGKMLGDPIGHALMSRVAADENLHHLFYRDLTAAAFALDPSSMVEALEHEVAHFAMPGTGIPNFKKHATAIAQAGIYDLSIHHDQILVPVVLYQWRLAELTALRPSAARAQERVLAQIERIGRIARRREERRAQSDQAGPPSG